ncbi:MAG: MmcQ/YjbR family DNA-binding protein [Bifidobacteriaceae bacterium]|jgi:predicted DNA-binding protein (MmcQ/YjbR family)|nr:MmcQ/YjbR family DNA-binding protein [Bifidobacteriaceae bacterium]
MARVWKPAYDPEDTVLAEVLRIVGGLPEAYAEPTWGVLTFRIGRRLFGWYQGGLAGTERLLIFKPVPSEHAILLDDPRFRPAPHANPWMALALDQVSDFSEVRELLTDAYTMVAPKELADQVGGKPE